MTGKSFRAARLAAACSVLLLTGGCPERSAPRPAVASEEARRAAERPATGTAGTEHAPRGADAAGPDAAGPDAASPGAAAESEHESPWDSREACLRALPKERAARARRGDVTRFGTWNIRWYPDGRPGKKPPEVGTDILWLACAIASIDVDVLAVQEMKTLPRATERTAELLAELDRLTGGSWRAGFDDCPQGATQHVGLLWDARRVRSSHARTEAALNPHGAPCKDSLRPGYAAELRFEVGAPLHVVAVHFKSGTERRSLELRERSFAALPQVLAAARSITPGAEVIFAGDFNTMGCAGCSPKLGAAAELDRVRARAEKAGLFWVTAEPGCTEYFRDTGQLLDGFFVTSGLARRVRGPARVSGLCGELGCRPARRVGQLPAARRLSDHCPVVLELAGE